MLRPMPLMPGMPEQLADTVLSKALAAGRSQIAAVALFSGVVNMLQLTVSLYMIPVAIGAVHATLHFLAITVRGAVLHAQESAE